MAVTSEDEHDDRLCESRAPGGGGRSQASKLRLSQTSNLMRSVICPLRQLRLIKSIDGSNEKTSRSLQFDHPCKRCHTSTLSAIRWQHAAGDRYHGKHATVVGIGRLASLRRGSDPFFFIVIWSRNVKAFALSGGKNVNPKMWPTPNISVPQDCEDWNRPFWNFSITMTVDLSDCRARLPPGRRQWQKASLIVLLETNALLRDNTG